MKMLNQSRLRFKKKKINFNDTLGRVRNYLNNPIIVNSVDILRLNLPKPRRVNQKDLRRDMTSSKILLETSESILD